MAEKKIERTPLYTFARVVFAVLFHTICPVKYYNKQALQQADAPYILISNHNSASDPILLAYPVKKYEIRFVGKRELTNNKFAEWIVNQLHMIPVSRHATDMTAMRTCMQTLKDGHVLGIFPEGTRHHAELMENVESGAAMIALRANVPIIPMYLSAPIRPFRRVRVRIGEPMQIDDIKEQGLNSDTIKLLCDRIRDTFYGLQAADNRK